MISYFLIGIFYVLILLYGMVMSALDFLKFGVSVKGRNNSIIELDNQGSNNTVVINRDI